MSIVGVPRFNGGRVSEYPNRLNSSDMEAFSRLRFRSFSSRSAISSLIEDLLSMSSLMISSRLLVSLCVLMVRLSMNSVSIMDIVYDGYHHIAVLMNVSTEGLL